MLPRDYSEYIYINISDAYRRKSILYTCTSVNVRDTVWHAYQC